MTPRQLRYFLAIVREGSVTAAARSLHIAQPALSQHLRTLETDLGVVLLERHARGVRPTEAGLRLARHALALQRHLDRIDADLRAAPRDTPTGRVHVAVAASVASAVVPGLLARLEREAPGIELYLHSPLSVRARRMVELGEVDFGLLPNVVDAEGIRSLPVYEERLCLMAHEALLAELPDPLPLRRLRDVDLAAPSREHDLRRQIERHASKAGISLRVRYTIDDSAILRALVESRLAAAIMPSTAFGLRLPPGIGARPIVRPVPLRVQALGWASERPLTRAARYVGRTLVAELHEGLARGDFEGRAIGAAPAAVLGDGDGPDEPPGAA